jgi:sorting nexin-9/18/33
MDGSTARHPLSLLQTMTSPHPELLSPSHSRKQPNEEVASRCETVLNTTMAEIETYHTQKVEDFSSLAKEHLDGEIEFYEQVSDIKNR